MDQQGSIWSLFNSRSKQPEIRDQQVFSERNADERRRVAGILRTLAFISDYFARLSGLEQVKHVINCAIFLTKTRFISKIDQIYLMVGKIWK
jgi:hypothetical protein